MEFFGLIGAIIEFTQKREEYSDEVKAVKATLESLKIIINNINSYTLPHHINIMLSEKLQESKELLRRASARPISWWSNFKNMLPRSDLQRIKEKNQQPQNAVYVLKIHRD